MLPDPIVFSRPYITKNEISYIEQTLKTNLWGKGEYTAFCESWLKEQFHSQAALITTSCTSALEMSALLIDIQPGDEVILPSYTFVSTANAFVMRGAVPVFVDIRPDTLNIDEKLIEQAITKRTKAIIAVHYGGVACAVDTIMEIAKRHGLIFIEDAAHAIGARVDGKPLGSAGHFSTLSFHETKNVTCGQGGALIINDEQYVERARILHDKGTNRFLFNQGKVDHYSWVDLGSNYVLSEINAAFLKGQIEAVDYITTKRRAIWQSYHERLAPLEEAGLLERPKIPEGCFHNGHIYYIKLPNRQKRDTAISALAKKNVLALFHYMPLHESIMGKERGRVASSLHHTESTSQCLLRLPLWIGMEEHIDYITENLMHILHAALPAA